MMRGQPQMAVLDLGTLAASTLSDSEGLAVALTMLESCLAGPDIPLDLIVQDLCSVPDLFEFILSTLPNAEGLVRRILDTYPTDPALVEPSFASTLLRRLSSVTCALPPGLLPSHTVHHIGRHKVYIEDALPVLTLLCSADFSNDEEGSGFLVHNKKQKRPRRKTKNNTPTIDPKPFRKLGAKVPLNNADASKMAREITEDLKKILKFYLEVLLEPSLAQQLKDAYISIGDNMAIHPSAPQETKVIEAADPMPSAYPEVQPMKAVLYFENADGLGDWRIFIGTGAVKKLRQLASSDKKIVVRKIKQLSKGHFSDENQKRLNGSSGIPIFEATIQQDLRLVYQIDVAPDHGEVERQAIKIYGIYTHTQLNQLNYIWDAMGQRLAGESNEYRRRCTFRNPPVHAGSDIYLPACFPPERHQSATKLTPLVLSDEYMELYALFVLEKYVVFSQALLHSLIVNQDVEYVFELTPQQRRIVECTTSCYVLGGSGTGKTTTMLFKMLGIQRAWEMQKSWIPKPRQIFVTKSSVLAQKAKEYFTKLLEYLAVAEYSVEELKRMQTRNPELGLVDADDEDGVNIPQKYSALEENHFPLFVTFDKLARMIAADVLSGAGSEVRHVAKFFTDEVEGQDSFVTYDVFARTYWPRFPHQLTKGLEPWVVFSEFMGIIKGSEKSLSCPDGFLDKETYCGLPAHSIPTFANQRQTLYAIFKAYCKLKKEHHHHDIADRTHVILRTLLGGTPLRGRRVDYLYIDEVQNNLLIDALLLRLICRNPGGLFWAGDAAQVINSFRWDDLKAFLCHIEQDQSMHLIQDRSVIDPTTFQLVINYCSRGGIVNCGQSVIERITRFWPDAIDGLQPEYGIVDGLKPIFFPGWDQDIVRYGQFLFGESRSRIEFGTQQCILVRDAEAVEKLRKEVGEIGLTMTVYDSNGLKFNDVLLYNFFEDSPVDASRWRVLLNHMEGEVDGQDLTEVHAPSFERNEGRFAGVCNELRLLYMCITRARKNLWIFDKSDKGEPMRMIWTSRNQVQNSTPGTDVPHLAVSSTEEEWESSGHDLFKRKRYSQAMHCFVRASQPRMAAICEAFDLREAARAKVDTAPKKAQQDAFLTTADAFMASGDDAPPSKDKLQYYHNAAECYVRAEDDRKAAIGYLSAQEYERAARHFRKAGLFDETLEVLHKHSQKIPSASSEDLYNVCRLFYCLKHDGNRPPFPLFSCVEEELEFYEDYDLDFARVTLLASLGRHLEAARLHLSENRPVAAIKDLLKARGSRNTIQQAVKILLDNLWRRCSFAIPSKEMAADRDVSELLKLASELPLDSLDPLDNEISMFRAIAQSDLACLGELSRVFIKEKRSEAALLALDHFFSRLPVLKFYNLQEMSLFLEQFREYCRLLHQIISHSDPLSVTSIKRLFCIREISNTEYGLEPRSFLHRSVNGKHHGPILPRPTVTTLSKQQVVIALRKYLAEHLRERVTKENKLCCDAVAFSQCLTFIVYGECNRVDCPQEHVKYADLDSKRYNIRIGIHLQQICILQQMYSVNPHLVRVSCALDWLTHLYEAFNPQFHVQGSTADLGLSMIPGAYESTGVMKHWVRDALHALRADTDRSAFLTNVLKLTSLLFAFDESSALQCIKQARFNAYHARAEELVYPDGRYVLEDIVSLFDGTQQTCISAGLLFLRHVLKSSLSVDLSVLCDCLEMVVGKISISWRLHFDPPLDSLVLPRGWLSSNRDFSTKKDIRVALVLDVLDHVRDLLMCLQSDTTSRTFTLSHTQLTPTLCNVFTSRICRALCLLTYNTRNADLRNKVNDIFDALRTAGPMQRAHPLYRKYVQARRDERLNAVVEYDADAEVVIEDLVQLLHTRRDPSRHPSLKHPRIKHVYFTNPPEIPSLLASQLVVAYSGDTPISVLRGDHVSRFERAEDEEVIQPKGHKIKPVDEIYEELQELAPVPNEPELTSVHESTETEIRAAHKIQATYRAYRNHREAQARAIGSGLKAQRNTIFIACLKNVYASGWRRTPYRTLYLWALPRLLVCLDKAMATAQEFRNKSKGLLLKMSHERLEELGKQANRMCSLLRDGHKLRKMIEPNAAMHQAKDKAALKQAVLDVKDLVHRLPALPPEIQEDLHFAYELVMVKSSK